MISSEKYNKQSKHNKSFIELYNRDCEPFGSALCTVTSWRGVRGRLVGIGRRLRCWGGSGGRRRGRGAQLGARPPRVQQRLDTIVCGPPPREPCSILKPHHHSAAAPTEVHLISTTKRFNQLLFIQISRY